MEKRGILRGIAQLPFQFLKQPFITKRDISILQGGKQQGAIVP